MGRGGAGFSFIQKDAKTQNEIPMLPGKLPTCKFRPSGKVIVKSFEQFKQLELDYKPTALPFAQTH